MDCVKEVYKADFGDKTYYIAECSRLPGCTSQGETLDDCLDEFESNMKVWAEIAERYGIDIPECLKLWKSCIESLPREKVKIEITTKGTGTTLEVHRGTGTNQEV